MGGFGGKEEENAVIKMQSQKWRRKERIEQEKLAKGTVGHSNKFMFMLYAARYQRGYASFVICFLMQVPWQD